MGQTLVIWLADWSPCSCQGARACQRGGKFHSGNNKEEGSADDNHPWAGPDLQLVPDLHPSAQSATLVEKLKLKEPVPAL